MLGDAELVGFQEYLEKLLTDPTVIEALVDRMLGYWIEFFAAAIRVEARQGHDRIMRLLALREDLSERVRTAFPRGRIAVEIADDLVAYPLLSVADAQKRYGRTNQANRNAIASLVDLGILEPYGDATYGRLYWNRQVFQVVDG